MIKTDIVEFFERLEDYCEYFDKCIVYGEDDFYDHITIPEEHNSEPITDDDKPDYIDSIMVGSISQVYEFNRDIIAYLRGEPQSYRDFFVSELIPKSVSTLERVLSRENIELTIYRFKIDPDSTHDVYKNLNCLYQILTNVESLIDDDKALKNLLNYNLAFGRLVADYKKEETDKAEGESDDQEARSDAFTWYGKPSELATLMSTLAENGYINTPMRDNNERNNEGFSRKILAHFKLNEGARRSVVNSLKDNTISPNNRFKIAMDKLPIKS
ncbi:MAG: hypothetical protein SNI91_06570 [Rikenellaceae bacterium]